VKRRDALGALGAAAVIPGLSQVGAASAADAAPAPAAAGAAARTFVLVHGAWHGGWCWRDIARGLRAAGHVVFTPTLTGLGERVHLASPAVNLTTHANDVIQVFEAEELQDVILVGHSYAGHVIPLVADEIRGRIRKLVFLDAVVARDGQPFLPPEAGAARQRVAIDGYLEPPPGLEFFGIPADHPLAPWVKRRITNHPLPTLLQTVRYRNGGPAGLPKTYIRCLRRRVMTQPDPVEVQLKGQPEWNWLTIDTGHDAMVTAPQELTAMLLELAR